MNGPTTNEILNALQLGGQAFLGWVLARLHKRGTTFHASGDTDPPPSERRLRLSIDERRDSAGAQEREPQRNDQS